MVFKKKFSDEKVLEAISTEVPRNASGIGKLVGCSANTVKRALDRLEAEGKVRRLIVETFSESESSLWLKVVDLSSVSREMLSLNENIIELNRELSNPKCKDEREDVLYHLSELEKKLEYMLHECLDCLRTDTDDKWVFELDKKIIEIMLKNLREQSEDPIASLLFDKHRIHIKCFPVPLGNSKFGMQFWCPICEMWHNHGIGEGHRVAHCVHEITRAGESFERVNPLAEHGYVINMMSKDELIAIRDNINSYLKKSRLK
jgi:DNA-binding Lrp family transcriptional regulator